MVLSQTLVLISFSIFPILSQWQKLSIEPRNDEGFVVIKGLAPPQTEMTLELGSIFKILKSDDVNGEYDVWQLHTLEPIYEKEAVGDELIGPQFRVQMFFEKIDLDSPSNDFHTFDTEGWSEQKLADEILAKHVYISKLSVSPSPSTNDPNEEIIIIRGLIGSQSEIKLMKGSTLKINGKENSIKLIDSDEIEFTKEPQFKAIDGLREDILFGQVQYKHGEQWYKLQPKYELINPSPMALKLKEHHDNPLNPVHGFPKKHQIEHCMYSLQKFFFLLFRK